LKGTGPIDYHLGMTFHQNDRNNLCISPQHYMEKMFESYKQMLNENPLSKANSPLDSNDHPEVDTSEFLDEDGIQQYQSLIGSMQWAISIGHFDITVHDVMSTSSFRTLPWLSMDNSTEPNTWSAISPS
jgi:hypothetical protein